MNEFQQAMNFETVRSLLNGNTSVAASLFDRISLLCDSEEPLVSNLADYCRVVEKSEYEVQNAYYKVRGNFEKLPENIVVIGRKNVYWPSGVSEVPFLYTCGNQELLAKQGISIVGTRHPSEHGMNLTRQSVSILDRDFVIVSGLAMGIDGVAHIQAIADGKDTIAVIGTPIDRVYPKEHERLQKMVSEKGLVVSQFAPGSEVQRYFFMQRNLLMSKISDATLVVESGDGGGGVREAEYSAKQGKDVFVFTETYNNRTYLWPRTFKGLKVVPDANAIVEEMKKEKKKVIIQPELF